MAVKVTVQQDFSAVTTAFTTINDRWPVVTLNAGNITAFFTKPTNTTTTNISCKSIIKWNKLFKNEPN